jgi:hypothetical protein
MTDFDLTLLNKFVLHCHLHSEKLTAELKKCIAGNFCVNSASPIAQVELELSVIDLSLTAFPKDDANFEIYSINLFESCCFGTFKGKQKFIRENLPLLEEIFIKWINNCWQKSGGMIYQIPVRLISKDSKRKVELITNQSVFRPIIF